MQTEFLYLSRMQPCCVLLIDAKYAQTVRSCLKLCRGAIFPSLEANANFNETHKTYSEEFLKRVRETSFFMINGR